MSKFTPGPWTFSTDNQFGDTRFYIAQQEGAPYTPHYSDVATVIAETCVGDQLAIQEANARLIAASPELLAALQGVLRVADRATDEFDAARAAIAKATGAA